MGSTRAVEGQPLGRVGVPPTPDKWHKAGRRGTSLRRQGLVKLHRLDEEVARPALKARLRPDDKRRRVKPKYANPDDPGQTWSGRGRRARWLEELIRAGAKLEDFRIEN